MIPFIPFDEGEALMDWVELTEALATGHTLPRAEIGDTFLYRKPDTLLSRAAWIDGMGSLVKTATVFPGNGKLGKPAVNGGVSLYSDTDGTLEAIVDFHLVTKWKTAADSLLAALRLAPEGAERVLVVGAGTVGASLIEAFRAGFPSAQIAVWNRTTAAAQDLAEAEDVVAVDDLEKAVRAADIVVTATMASEPVIKGAWLRPGQHLNLIGAYRADMRETDDEALTRGAIYVDSRDTTLAHIGELKTPIEDGVIAIEDIRADFYDLAHFRRGGEGDITLFKNGGGAHLDLMTARYILDKWEARQAAKG